MPAKCICGVDKRCGDSKRNVSFEPLVTVPSMKLFAVAVTHTLQGTTLPGPWSGLTCRCRTAAFLLQPFGPHVHYDRKFAQDTIHEQQEASQISLQLISKTAPLCATVGGWLAEADHIEMAE